MGTSRLRFVFVAVALLLEPTLGDVLVQPGFGPSAGQSSKNSADQSGATSKNQQSANAQKNYMLQSQNRLQLLNQQHKLEQQYLQQQHQLEHNQLLQLQQQQLQNPAQFQYPGNQGTDGDVLGTIWGRNVMTGPGGALNHGKIFSLGPFGLQSLGFGNGIGSLPLLMSPYQPPYVPGSTQYGNSLDGTTQRRSRRDAGDSRESKGKKFRQKTSRSEHDDVAASPTLKPKPDDATPPDTQPTKRHGDKAGTARSSVGLLDPLGLLDKTEDLIGDLTSGHLPGPMGLFPHGGHPPQFPNFLNEEYSGNPKIEEHVVTKVQQNPYQTDTTGQHSHPHQTQDSIVGGSRYALPHSLAYRPSQLFGPYGSPYGYSTNPPAYSLYRPYFRNAAGPMEASGSRMVMGYPRSNGQAYQQTDPMFGAQNPASNPNDYQQRGTQDMPTGNAEIMPDSKDASGYPTNGDSFTGGPNHMQQSSTGYNNGPGNSFNPMTGNSKPTAWDGGPIEFNPDNEGADATGKGSGMVGNPMAENFYNPNDDRNYYRSQKHGYDFDDVFDQGYNYDYGGYNRIYENNGYGLSPYGGGYPHHHHHHHQSYVI